MSIFSKLKSALSRSSGQLSEGITSIFTKEKLDAATLESLEELLITADLGVDASAHIVQAFGKEKFDKNISAEEAKRELAKHISALFPADSAFTTGAAKPFVIMMVGVNGNGKTTTIGKLAHQLQQDGKKVMLAAADTFRAAAAEQLEVWAARLNCPIVKGAPESDPAGVAYAALERAKKEHIDVLLVDTAGRLQNKTHLMDELKKIIRVIKKLDDTAPHSVMQVLDATTGQNALSQVEVFKQMVDVSGLIVTKLDGTAKGGVVVALAKKFNLPVYFIGVGESIDDLQPFSAQEFAENLVGL